MIFILVRKKIVLAREILFGAEIFHFDWEHFIKYHIERQPLRGSMNSARKKMQTNKGEISYKKKFKKQQFEKNDPVHRFELCKNRRERQKKEERNSHMFDCA